jgi:hypothetical protein
MKGLRHQCTTTDECEDAMICEINNSTKSTISKNTKNNVNKEKLCLCDEVSGITENVHENHCNGMYYYF